MMADVMMRTSSMVSIDRNIMVAPNNNKNEIKNKNTEEDLTLCCALLFSLKILVMVRKVEVRVRYDRHSI